VLSVSGAVLDVTVRRIIGHSSAAGMRTATAAAYAVAQLCLVVLRAAPCQEPQCAVPPACARPRRRLQRTVPVRMLLPCSVWLSCVLPCVTAAVRSGAGMRTATAAAHAVALLGVVALRAAPCHEPQCAVAPACARFRSVCWCPALYRCPACCRVS
jgi:hypothetical protein